MSRRRLAVALLVGLAGIAAAAAEEAPGAPGDLERNLRWILARERAPAREPARVGVYADAGAWHEGARALVAALESASVTCRVLDRSAVTAEGLAGLEAVVVPGGWAPAMRDALGEPGQAALRAFVDAGGRYVGVCAGAYLAAREVRWEGRALPYPLALLDGAAEGPLADLAPWPRAAAVRVTWTERGRARGLGPDDAPALYLGGPRVLGGASVEVLARYPDGSAAVTASRYGRGEVLLVGVHLEVLAPDGVTPPPPGAGATLRRLVLGVRSGR